MSDLHELLEDESAFVLLEQGTGQYLRGYIQSGPEWEPSEFVIDGYPLGLDVGREWTQVQDSDLDIECLKGRLLSWAKRRQLEGYQVRASSLDIEAVEPDHSWLSCWDAQAGNGWMDSLTVA